MSSKTKTLRMMFEDDDTNRLLQTIELALQNKDESPIFIEKVIPLIKAVYSVIEPLKEQKLLFNPEGEKLDRFDFNEFLRWSDLVSLKTLYFILKQSNEEGILCRTQYNNTRYKQIDLTVLQEYLSRYNINLIDEKEDFLIAHYNLHIGIATIIKEAVNR